MTLLCFCIPFLELMQHLWAYLSTRYVIEKLVQVLKILNYLPRLNQSEVDLKLNYWAGDVTQVEPLPSTHISWLWSPVLGKEKKNNYLKVCEDVEVGPQNHIVESVNRRPSTFEIACQKNNKALQEIQTYSPHDKVQWQKKRWKKKMLKNSGIYHFPGENVRSICFVSLELVIRAFCLKNETHLSSFWVLWIREQTR